jgi:hypothetical protein
MTSYDSYNKDFHLGKMAEINKSQMEQALMRARQFGRTDYLGNSGFSQANSPTKKQKSPLTLNQQISGTTPIRRTSVNTSDVMERPKTNASEYKIPTYADNHAVYQANANTPVKANKFQFMCSSCNVPLFSSKDFMPHTTQ